MAQEAAIVKALGMDRDREQEITVASAQDRTEGLAATASDRATASQRLD
jgi:hypothetical protein